MLNRRKTYYLLKVITELTQKKKTIFMCVFLFFLFFPFSEFLKKLCAFGLRYKMISSWKTGKQQWRKQFAETQTETPRCRKFPIWTNALKPRNTTQLKHRCAKTQKKKETQPHETIAFFATLSRFYWSKSQKPEASDCVRTSEKISAKTASTGQQRQS